VGGSLGSLFLVDMIPKVCVIVDGLDGLAGVQYPLLQNQFLSFSWTGETIWDYSCRGRQFLFLFLLFRRFLS